MENIVVFIILITFEYRPTVTAGGWQVGRQTEERSGYLVV